MEPRTRLGIGCAAVCVFLYVLISLPGFLAIRERRALRRTMARIQYVGAALHRYQRDHGGYPRSRSAAELLKVLQLPNRSELGEDGWGNKMRYEARNCNHMCTGFFIASPGSDRAYEHSDLTSYRPGYVMGGRSDLVYGEKGWIQYPEGITPEGMELVWDGKRWVQKPELVP